MTFTDFFINFSISILGSLLASFIVSNRVKKQAERTYEQLEHAKVNKVFSNQMKAEKDIIESIKKSRTLRVFAVRGATFCDREHSCIAQEVLKNAYLEQSYLVSSLNNPYLEKREKILGVDLKASVAYSITCLENVASNHKNIQLRLHNEVVRFRIILLDNYLYLSFVEDKKAKETEILKISKNSPLYDTYSTLFDELWDKYETQ